MANFIDNIIDPVKTWKHMAQPLETTRDKNVARFHKKHDNLPL